MSKIGPPRNAASRPNSTDLPVIPPLPIDELDDGKRAVPRSPAVARGGNAAPDATAKTRPAEAEPQPAVSAEVIRRALPVSLDEERRGDRTGGADQGQPRPPVAEERPVALARPPDWIQLPTTRFSATSLDRFAEAVWVCCQAGGPNRVGIGVAGHNNEQVFIQISTNRNGALCISLITGEPGLARSLEESRSEICDRLVERGLEVAEVRVELGRPGLTEGRGQGSGGENEREERAEDAGEEL